MPLVLVPSQPFRGICTQPARVHLLRELFTELLHIACRPAAKCAKNGEFLEAVTISASGRGKHGRWSTKHAADQRTAASHEFEERHHTVTRCQGSIHVECSNVLGRRGAAHCGMSICSSMPQNSGQLLETTVGSLMITPSSPSPSTAKAIAKR